MTLEADALYARALLQHAARRPEAALADCEAILAGHPAHAEALHLRGVALSELRQTEEALASYDRALACRPDYAEAHFNRGLVLATLGRFDGAVESFAAALALAPRVADIYVGRAEALEKLGRFEEAARDYDKAFALNPDCAWLCGARLFAKMRLCDWRTHKADLADLIVRVASGAKATPALSSAAFADRPDIHRQAAALWTASEYPANPILGPPPVRAQIGRIRIGYFSMDFREHPAARGAAVVLEGHDRTRFEVYAFSYGPNTGDAMRARIEKAADHFFDVRGKSDTEVAQLARHLGIDIAVDLAGHTHDARPGIFALRAASLQVTYLIYPMLAAYMDYAVIEERLLPKAQWSAYPEKMAVVPCLIPNDRLRPAVETATPRAQLQLPEEGVVFCGFNSSYKITPAMFDLWVRIVADVTESVLWLGNMPAAAAANLRRAAAKRGVAPERLVFANYVSAEAHFARLRSADLFLDTFPFTAQTTALDALWAGVPVVTLEGDSMPARGSASIVAAAGLLELVTHAPDTFIEVAVGLARHPARRVRLRVHLDALRAHGALFEPETYIKPLEAVLIAMITRHRAGLAPDHITVAAP